MSSRSFSSKPLHVQLRDDLIDRVAAGHWGPGEILPNELELSREYGLSPGTVRKALDWMEESRIILRQQGRGTFVRDPSDDEMIDRYERLRNRDGSSVRDQVSEVECTEGEATAQECEKLRLGAGSIVRRVRQIRTYDDRPYKYERVVVPAILFPLLDAGAGNEFTLLRAAKTCGVILGDGEERISCADAGPELAERLKCQATEPLLQLERIVYTIKRQPAEWRLVSCKLDGKYYSAPISLKL